MVGRGEWVLHDDRVVDVPAEGRHGVQRKVRADFRIARGRGDDHEAPEFDAGFPRGRPQVPQEGTCNGEQEDVEQCEEQRAGVPTA